VRRNIERSERSTLENDKFILRPSRFACCREAENKVDNGSGEKLAGRPLCVVLRLNSFFARKPPPLEALKNKISENMSCRWRYVHFRVATHDEQWKAQIEEYALKTLHWKKTWAFT
jgi:hypothetical protein